jgi:DNA-binding NtrC family response regulator
MAETETPRGGDETVLVVDDEESFRTLTKDALEFHGYRVVLAVDGEQAIDIYKEQERRIDLVILDMVMPKMGGHETFLRMKTCDPNVKVLLSTGYSRGGKTQEIIDSGIRGFIQKPYKIDALLSKVRSLLDSEN